MHVCALPVVINSINNRDNQSCAGINFMFSNCIFVPFCYSGGNANMIRRSVRPHFPMPTKSSRFKQLKRYPMNIIMFCVHTVPVLTVFLVFSYREIKPLNNTLLKICCPNQL